MMLSSHYFLINNTVVVMVDDQIQLNLNCFKFCRKGCNLRCQST